MEDVSSSWCTTTPRISSDGYDPILLTKDEEDKDNESDDTYLHYNLYHHGDDDDDENDENEVEVPTFALWREEDSSLFSSAASSSSSSSSSSFSLSSICCRLVSSEFWQQHAFCLGSFLLLIASVMGVVETWKENETDDQHSMLLMMLMKNKFGPTLNYDDHDVDEPLGPTTMDTLEYWSFYKALCVCGTFLYLLDSILFICTKFQEQDSSNNNNENNNNSRELLLGGQQQQQGEVTEEVEETDESTLTSASLTHIFFIDDMEEEDTSLWFAIIFGIASALDLCSSFLQDSDYPWPSYIFECSSVYLFGLSANFMLYSKRKFYLRQSKQQQQLRRCSLVRWGDILFWIGCTADIIVCILDNPTSNANDWWEAIGSMSSSLFWFIDAILYELAGEDIFDMELVVHDRRGDAIAIPLEDEEVHEERQEEEEQQEVRGADMLS